MTSVLTIAGSDPVAGAGLQADLKAIEALGLHALTVVTCVTAQNTRGVSSVFPLPPEEVRKQIGSVFADVDVAAVKTGMLYSADIVAAVRKGLSGYGGPVVVDPVMSATSGDSLHLEGFVQELREALIPVADLVTPNVHEAELLTGVKVTDRRSAGRAARSILRDGAGAVLVKGGHIGGDEAVDWLFGQDRVVRFASPRLEGDFHGTGCVLASTIAGRLAMGDDMEGAVRVSKELLFKGISASERIGCGAPCVNPMAVPRAEMSRVRVLEELEGLTRELEEIGKDLLPEVGTNIGYSVAGATEPADVAAFTGRIVRVGERSMVVGCPRFGASKHVARIVLAASTKDPTVRCAMNIKYSQRNLRACRAAKLSVASFDRSKEPKGASSMTWGVTSAIERRGSVPDVIFDRGGHGKEPMIRILGHDPADVVRKLTRITDALDRG